ncbi:hypothetical protein [Candidatus Protochlamydia phocaeensis]|uniref:hypothetical protein n=1 Tax=Candidatus Protochlamydia phocaeensis TaxID=1414722 RepID=UPI000837E441|nr:hypothetical protein [Candidatus Protochlamydia phocaeensis]
MTHSEESTKDKRKQNESIHPECSEKLFSILENFQAQIQSLPKLIQEVAISDQALSQRFQELRIGAYALITQLDQQRPLILEKFDGLLFPLAKEILDDLFREAERLRDDLEKGLESLQKLSSMDWVAHINDWRHICIKWEDQKRLTEDVLKLLSERTSQLIDKDIQVVQDYQNQSIAHLSIETQEFKKLETRLAQATEEPLKYLRELKTQVKHPSSLKQASDWIANLHKQRESYFDQLLMKIDSIVKEVVIPDEGHDLELLKEVDNELDFVEKELNSIYHLLPQLDREDEKNILFTMARLEGLYDHVNDFESISLSPNLKNRLNKIKDKIELTIFIFKRAWEGQ